MMDKNSLKEGHFLEDYKRSSDGYSVVSDVRSEQLFDKLIWTIDDVCSFTTYKKGTVYNLVSSGNIPYRKRGKRLFFIPCEILSWLKGDQDD